MIDSDDLWPRTPEYRYRLYARRGDDLEVLAASPSSQGLGSAIVHLDEDAVEAGRSLADEGQLGVLDVCSGGSRGRWIVKPWSRP